jgi:hypothetical protein
MIILLLTEIHVIYLLVCICFIFYKPDIVRIYNLYSAESLLAIKLLIVVIGLMATILLIRFSGVSDICGLASYFLNLSLSNYIHYYAKFFLVDSALGSIIYSYILYNTFEFLIITIQGLLAIYSYYLIISILHYNKLLMAGFNTLRLSSFFKGPFGIYRKENQALQLSRCAVFFKHNNIRL